MNLKNSILKKINDVHNKQSLRHNFSSFKDLDLLGNSLFHVYIQGDYFIELDPLFYNLTKKEINHLIYNSNLNCKNSDQNIPLHIIFAKGVDFLSEKIMTYIIRNSNLNSKNFLGENPLSTYLSNPNRQKLSNKNLNYLLKNTNLNSKDELYNMTTSMYFFLSRQQFLLNEKQITYLIKNSNLNLKDKDKWNLSCFILNYLSEGKTKNIPISTKTLNIIEEHAANLKISNFDPTDSNLIQILKNNKIKKTLEKKTIYPLKHKKIFI